MHIQRKNREKKGRTAAPFVWLTIGLLVATVVGSTLIWALLHWPLSNHGYVEGFLTVFLAFCGGVASVLIAKRALNADDRREEVLSCSLRPEHFTNGQSFSRSDFDSWILESKKAVTKALTAYLCCIAGGILLSVLFSQGIGGVFGNILALLCVFGGLIMGGSLAKKRPAERPRIMRIGWKFQMRILLRQGHGSSKERRHGAWMRLRTSKINSMVQVMRVYCFAFRSPCRSNTRHILAIICH